jgi:hypothetical protein
MYIYNVSAYILSHVQFQWFIGFPTTYDVIYFHKKLYKPYLKCRYRLKSSHGHHAATPDGRELKSTTLECSLAACC